MADSYFAAVERVPQPIVHFSCPHCATVYTASQEQWPGTFSRPVTVIEVHVAASSGFHQVFPCLTTNSTRATPGHAGQDVVFKTVQQIGVELAVDAFEISLRIDHLVLLSSDGDLRALVESGF